MTSSTRAGASREVAFTGAAGRLGLAAAAIAGAALVLPLAPDGLRAALPGAAPGGGPPAVGIALAGLALSGLQHPGAFRHVALAASALVLALALGLTGLFGRSSQLAYPASALGLGCVAGAILLAAQRGMRHPRVPQLLAGVAAATGLLALLGHLYEVQDLRRLGARSMAPSTALAIGLLGAAGLVARPEFALARVLAGRSVGAAHLRRALPALTLIPLASGLLAMAGVRLGVWDWGTAFAVFTLLSMSILGVEGSLHAQRIDALVRERRRLESLSRRTFENAAVGMAHVTGDGRWLQVNDRLCEILGWPRDALLGGAPGAPVLDGELLRTAAPVPVEHRFLTRDGRPRWVELAVAPDRPAGRTERFIAVVSDLTPRKRAEADLELAQRALACSSDAVVIAAAEPRDGRIVYVNPAFTRITGYAPEEALGRSWRLLAEGSEPAPELGGLCALLDQGDSVSILMKSRAKQGSPLWTEVRIAPVVDAQSGAITHHLGVLEDVTERLSAAAERERLLAEAVEARAEAERAGRAKDEFFALISHELRSPLGAIIGWLAVLRRDVPEDVRARALDVLERNSALLTRLIGDLLDASRIAGGKLEIERVPFDLLEVVTAAVTALEPIARDRQLELALQADGRPAHVEGDPERMDQVVRNLIGNALKFTPPGGRVDVRLRREGASLLLEVRDDGQGIAADDLPRVFERFEQAGGGLRGAERGLGLGLSIVRHLVELHGGRVEAASPGRSLGTTFSVSLPAAAPPRRLAPSRVGRSDALEGLCVLLLQPDRATAEGLALALEAADGEVVWVRDAGELSSPKHATRPHVLVAELKSGVEKAADLLRELRKAPHSRLVAAVALSTDDTLASRRRARDAGFDGYLAHPFEPDQLVASIRALVDRAPRVVVVDDDDASADSLALLLARRGFEVERAYDADTALAVVDGFRPDAVVTDLELGGRSGVELAAQLRRRGTRLRIIAATGRDRDELGSAARHFDGYVRKPIELDTLLALLDARA